MTREELNNLERGDRLADGARRRRAQVVRRTHDDILILWEDGKVELCGIWDPVFNALAFIGRHRLGQSWLLDQRDKSLSAFRL
jgi:hypothetical protein